MHVKLPPEYMIQNRPSDDDNCQLSQFCGLALENLADSLVDCRPGLIQRVNASSHSGTD